jgi:hypothetical protein
MSRPILAFIMVCSWSLLAMAGPERSSDEDKEVMQLAPPSCESYRAHEWEFDFWGTVAFPIHTGHYHDFPSGDLFDGGPIDSMENEHFDIGEWSKDRLINRDNAWGGGADIKYFFSKYWGLGAEGFILDAKSNIAGSGLFTLTLRYPIGCSRFAPYAWAGAGAISGGSHEVRFFNERQGGNEPEFTANESIDNHHILAIGQFGAGLELRVTRHIGVMGDVSYNAVQQGNNDFWMARFGVILAY